MVVRSIQSPGVVVRSIQNYADSSQGAGVVVSSTQNSVEAHECVYLGGCVLPSAPSSRPPPAAGDHPTATPTAEMHPDNILSISITVSLPVALSASHV